jgi:hypothetical protein
VALLAAFFILWFGRQGIPVVTVWDELGDFCENFLLWGNYRGYCGQENASRRLRSVELKGIPSASLRAGSSTTQLVRHPNQLLRSG